MTWYYYFGEVRRGPFDVKTIKDLALRGIITPETILENSRGQRAYAEHVGGLVFPSPKVANEAAPVTPPISGGNSLSENNASSFSAGGFSIPSASDEYRLERNVADGTNRAAVAAASEVKKPPADLSAKGGFWDSDLSRFFGDPGVEVNQMFLKNIAVLMRLCYWIFCVTYWFWIVGLIVVSINGYGEEGVIGGIFIIFPLAAIAFFFFRLYMKLPLELIKYVMHSNLVLKRLERKIDELSERA